MLPLDWVQPIWYLPWLILPGLLAVWGVVTTLRRRPYDLVAWFFVFHMGLFALYTATPWPRYMFVAFPVFVAMLSRGARDAGRRLFFPSRTTRLAASAAALTMAVVAWFPSRGAEARSVQAAPYAWLALGLVPWIAPLRNLVGSPLLPRALAVAAAGFAALQFTRQVEKAQVNIHADDATFGVPVPDEAARWVNANTSPDDVVMFQWRDELHGLTGRRVIVFPETGRAEVLKDTMRRWNVKWLIAGADPLRHVHYPTENARVAVLEASDPGLLRPVHTGAKIRAFEVVWAK